MRKDTARGSGFLLVCLGIIVVIQIGGGTNPPQTAAPIKTQEKTEIQQDKPKSMRAVVGDTRGHRGGMVCTDVDVLEKYVNMFAINPDAWLRAIQNDSHRCQIYVRGETDQMVKVEQTLRDAVCVSGLADKIWPESRQQNCLWIGQSNLLPKN
jgi:hypothetical protein